MQLLARQVCRHMSWGAYRDPAKESRQPAPFGAVRGLAGWRGLCLATPCLSQEVAVPFGVQEPAMREGGRSMIYAGIDIAKSSHVIGAVDERGKDAAKPMQFANSAEGFGKCAAYLEGLGAPAEEMLVGMEATGHYWLPLFSFLHAQGYDVVVINPIRTDAMRRFKGLSGQNRPRRLHPHSRHLAPWRVSPQQARRRVDGRAAPAHTASPGSQGERRRPQAPGDSGAGPGISRVRFHLFRHLRGEPQGVPEEVPDPEECRGVRVDALGNTPRARVAASSDGRRPRRSRASPGNRAASTEGREPSPSRSNCSWSR